jgi:hypothetical protein
MLLSVPATYSHKGLEALHTFIHSTYGGMHIRANETVMPGYVLPQITPEALADYVRYAHSLNVEFIYVMNKADLKIDDELCTHLRWLEDIHVDAIAMTNPDVMMYAKKHHSFRIESSVMCDIDSIDKALSFKDHGCDVISLSFMKRHSLSFIESVKKKSALPIKMLVNNICLPNCPYADQHGVNQGEGFDYLPIKCLRFFLENKDYADCSTFIAPDDVRMYRDVGVDFFKIGGRGKTDKWVYDVASVYAKEKEVFNFYPLANVLGREFAGASFLRFLIALIPEIGMRGFLRVAHALTGHLKYSVLLQTKNMKELILLYFYGGGIVFDKAGVRISEKKKKQLLREISTILDGKSKEKKASHGR